MTEWSNTLRNFGSPCHLKRCRVDAGSVHVTKMTKILSLSVVLWVLRFPLPPFNDG